MRSVKSKIRSIAVTESFTYRPKSMFLSFLLKLRLCNYWKMAIITNLMIYSSNKNQISAPDTQVHNSTNTKM